MTALVLDFYDYEWEPMLLDSDAMYRRKESDEQLHTRREITWKTLGTSKVKTTVREQPLSHTHIELGYPRYILNRCHRYTQEFILCENAMGVAAFDEPMLLYLNKKINKPRA